MGLLILKIIAYEVFLSIKKGDLSPIIYCLCGRSPLMLQRTIALSKVMRHFYDAPLLRGRNTNLL